jgi:hypothetical protein
MNFLTRVPFDLNGPLTIAMLLSPTVRDAAIILDVPQMCVVFKFEAVRSLDIPRPSVAAWLGGFAV